MHTNEPIENYKSYYNIKEKLKQHDEDRQVIAAGMRITFEW